MIDWLVTYNNSKAVEINQVPEYDYLTIREELITLLKDKDYHVANYFAVPYQQRCFKMFIILLCDSKHTINIASYTYDYYSQDALESMVNECAALHVFERDITERYGIRFENSPWDKPLRFPVNAYDKNSSIDNYPFYKINSDSLHEVNVGPIHAGIIEPGAFRFNCHGEKVLHLEIALGYQHRNIEQLIVEADSGLKRNVLCESIAGDSAVAHTSCYCAAIEKLSAEFNLPSRLALERTMAQELERVAMHLADTGALCMDVGYQLGQVALEALRTLVINSTQLWGGNRFGKGLIRLGGSNFPLDKERADKITEFLVDVRFRVEQVIENIKNSPSVLARFEQCGVLERSQAQALGAVGVVARASGMERDLRVSHPYLGFDNVLEHNSLVRKQGDVMARVMVRFREILQSIDYVLALFEEHDFEAEMPRPDYNMSFAPNCLSVALVEGFRGEICHVALTDNDAHLMDYRVKDASLHNWSALGVVLRGEGISDFPICNKSFNLSYCGFDL